MEERTSANSKGNNRVEVPEARDGKDPVGAMGADAPLAILSDKPQLLYITHVMHKMISRLVL